MNKMKEEILEKLAEILEEDSISLTQELKSFDEWDSLTTLSLIAMADSDYNISLTNEIVDQFLTVKDVLEYIIKNDQ
jgi:acyl carrier protein